MHKWSDIDLADSSRKEILRGGKPSLSWPGDEECPVSKGDEVVVHSIRSEAGPVPQVWIRISDVQRNRKGDHVAHYYIAGDDRPLFLAGATGYTRSAQMSIDCEASVIDPEALEVYGAEARLKRSHRPEDPRRQERRIKDRIRATMKGLDDQGQLALLAGLERVLLEAEGDE